MASTKCLTCTLWLVKSGDVLKSSRYLLVFSSGQRGFWAGGHPRNSLCSPGKLDTDTTTSAATQQLCSLITIPANSGLPIDAHNLQQGPC